MSDSTGASIRSSTGRYRCDGIPEKCWCDNRTVTRMSKSEPNPCRRYFRCELAHANKMVNDNHLFKWVDEALVFDVKKLTREVEVLKEEMKENQKVMEVMYEKFEFGLVEAENKRAKMLKNMVFAFGCGILLMFGVGKFV